jgi:uncharacterized protein
MSGTLDIAGHSVAAGGSLRAAVPALELADGTQISLPLVLINGVRPGPRLYLGAAIHGDEVTGTAILARALGAVDVKRLSGSIVCVPVQHPLAVHADHRLPLSQFLKSPLDQVPADAWTCFPGDLSGNVAQIMAATLFCLIEQCDAAIDIHTPTRGGRYVPIAILPHPDLGEAAEQALALANDLGTGWVMRGRSGMYVSDGILCVEATRAGVPCFTFEIGEGGRLEEESIATGARCILNALRSLKMIGGEIERPPRTHVMRSFLGLRAQRGGLLFTKAELGQAINKGDLLCSIHNVYGDEIESIVAPCDGLLVRTTTLATVSRGERVATLGLM